MARLSGRNPFRVRRNRTAIGGRTRLEENIVFTEGPESAENLIERRPETVNIIFVRSSPKPERPERHKPRPLPPSTARLALPAPRSREALDQAAIQRGIMAAEAKHGAETRDFDRTLFALSELAKSRGVDVSPRDVANEILGRLTPSLKPNEIDAQKIKASLAFELRDTEKRFKDPSTAFRLSARFGDFPSRYNPQEGKQVAQRVIDNAVKERKLRRNTKAYKAFLEKNAARIEEIEKSAQKEHAQEWLEKAIKHLRERSQLALEDERKLQFAEREIRIARAFGVEEKDYGELPELIKRQRAMIKNHLNFLSTTISEVSKESGVKAPKFVKRERTLIERRLGIGRD
ncbi:MAG: hypothetical protein ACREQA_20740 [Candidatus Binatia bacterium]